MFNLGNTSTRFDIELIQLIHIRIIQRLELATDRIELEAAIWAGDQICARSNRFPSVIFSKVADKLESKNKRIHHRETM